MAPVPFNLLVVCWKDHCSFVVVFNTDRASQSNPSSFVVRGSSLSVWGLYCRFCHLPRYLWHQCGLRAAKSLGYTNIQMQYDSQLLVFVLHGKS